MTGAVRVTAPAKINLALYVGAPRPDGYHPVATLMTALDGLADTVEVRRADRRRVTCPGVPERDNLAWRALDALEREVGRPLPAAVAITKRIPSGAGLGGGSSDAAAVLRAARRLFALDLGDADLERVAAAVGSDVPFFVRGGAQWATGRGEVLSPARVPDVWAVVTHPARHLATGDVYRAFDRVAAPSRPVPGPVGDPLTGPGVRNDLWPAALALAPRLGAVARALRAAGARRVLLCGSGGSMAGLCPDRAGAERVAAGCPGTALAVVRLPALPDAGTRK